MDEGEINKRRRRWRKRIIYGGGRKENRGRVRRCKGKGRRCRGRKGDVRGGKEDLGGEKKM